MFSQFGDGFFVFSLSTVYHKVRVRRRFEMLVI